MSDFSLTFLGTGASVGVPVIGCPCGICTSDDPKNKRTRASVVVRGGGTTLLVDTGPDLRMQALREGLKVVDAVFYTHTHMDHVVGFDDLRAFCWGRTEPMPLYATATCMADLRRMFGWAFSAENTYPGYVKPAANILTGPVDFGGIRVTPLPVTHSGQETVGFLFEYPRAKRVAYIPDVKHIPDATLDLMREVDVLIVDALRPTVHPSHMSVGEALAVSEHLRAKETWLTHLGHEIDHPELEAKLPPGVRVAWDGLVIR